jgi:hypothetical protein
MRRKTLYSRLFFLFISIIFYTSILSINVFAQFGGGVGSNDDPYQISNAEHLQKLAHDINSGVDYDNMYFKVMNDIDLSTVCGAELNGGTSWKPIGNTDNHFKGVFDGSHFKITGLYINEPDKNCQGLFSYNNGVIKNITIYGKVIGNEFIAGICAYCLKGGEIESCINNATIKGNKLIGGICGSVKDTSIVQNCLNNGEILGIEYWAGGICGYLGVSSQVASCLNNGNINSNELGGGICGANSNSSIVKDCMNYGVIKGNKVIGSICGVVIDNSIVQSCSNNGEILGIECWAGGICGYLDEFSQVTSCLNIGNINSNEWCGGICGANYNSSMVKDCMNCGVIKGNNVTGGICGGNSAIITTCLNTGNVQQTVKSGSICGWNNSGLGGSIELAYYDKQISPILGIGFPENNIESSVKSMLTSELTDGVFNIKDWQTPVLGFYPIPEGVDTENDITAISRIAIFLNEVSKTDFETIGNIQNDFTISNASDVTWKAYPENILHINHEECKIKLLDSGTVVLSVEKGSAKKSLELNINYLNSINSENHIIQKLYPNPTLNKFFIEGDFYNDEIKILNLAGGVLYREILNAEKTEIDISNLPAGVYFVVTKGKIGKVIKN